MPEVRATVRLQFHSSFTLKDAIPLVAYFSRLGISHIYASPLLKARAGSMHGYDVVDPTQINPELGGEEALYRLVAELRKHNMGLIVDMVSNHMAVGSNNPWWQDVLKWGLKSPYGQFFDIEWSSPDPLLKGQLLLPFLHTHYGEVLASGSISIHFDSDTGEFYARYFDHHFPLCPASYTHILYNSDDTALHAFAQPFAALEADRKGWHLAQALHKKLQQAAQQPQVQASIANALALYQVTATTTPTTESDHSNESSARNVDWRDNENLQRLHQLLELQYYRLANWRTAADDINWRRFFDINELAGLRVERQEVFEALHIKLFELIAKGQIDGLRIDHVDGLANPRAYCRKLRRRLDRLQAQRPDGLQEHIPIYVEKILADGEQLATHWMADGTTGYEFMNQVSLLQHDPKGAFQLYDLWSRVSGREGTFTDEVIEARRLVLASGLAGDVETVAQGLLAIARLDIATRDLTLGALRRALIELIVHFPVYRTYVTACGRTRADEIAFFEQALTAARTTLAESDWPLLDYLERWLGGQPLHELPPGSTRSLRQKVLARFQQLTSPAAAKAVEDTACYRSAVLLSRNDVGFDPQHFSATPAQFHLRNSERASTFPRNLLTTATHDHKRGEDTRARLAVISERPVWFSGKVQQWQSLTQPLKATLEDGVAPSPGDELMLYQILLGCWPLTLAADDAKGMEAFLERLLRWQEKAVREAKLRSTWTAPNKAYEASNRHFLTQLLCSEELIELRQDIATSAQSIAPAGALNGLTQTLLRMTAPGIPDLYQGAEFWDFSLVDPDNRQPVDFTQRSAALIALEEPGFNLNDVIHQWRDGRVKQWLISRTLATRQKYPELFAKGDYQPLAIEGEHADHLIAFARHYQGEYLVVIAPRLTVPLLSDSPIPFIPPTAWGDTQVILPAEWQQQPFEHELATGAIANTEGRLAVQDLLAEFPVGVLHSAQSVVNRSKQYEQSTQGANNQHASQCSTNHPKEGKLDYAHL